MSVLSDSDIRKLLAKQEIIKRADLDNCLGPASYQLRIGSVRVPGTEQEVLLEPGQEFFIRPGGMVLIGAVEEVSLTKNICGFLKLKSSLGRAGYVSWDQGFVEPGYEGSLTIALHNLTGQYNIFRGGQSVCHLILMKLSSESNGYDGEYKKSTGATGSKFPQALVFGALPEEMINEGAKAAARTLGTEVAKAVGHDILKNIVT